MRSINHGNVSSLDNYNLIEEEHNSPRDMLLIDLFFIIIFAEKDLFHLNWYIFRAVLSLHCVWGSSVMDGSLRLRRTLPSCQVINT